MYLDSMILRLKKDGEDSFKAWIAKQMPISRLAEEVGVSATAMHQILAGKYKRSKHLGAIAEVVGAEMKREKDGSPVFVVPDPVSPVDEFEGDELGMLAEFLDIVKGFEAHQWKSMKEFAKFLKQQHKQEEDNM